MRMRMVAAAAAAAAAAVVVVGDSARARQLRVAWVFGPVCAAVAERKGARARLCSGGLHEMLPMHNKERFPSSSSSSRALALPLPLLLPPPLVSARKIIQSVVSTCSVCTGMCEAGRKRVIRKCVRNCVIGATGKFFREYQLGVHVCSWLRVVSVLRSK
jgi:hypothetical protein